MCQVATGITRKTRYGTEGTHTLGGQGRRLRKQHWNRSLLVREQALGGLWGGDLGGRTGNASAGGWAGPGRAGIWGAGALRLESSWGRKGAGEPSRRAQDSSGRRKGAAQATDTPACLPHCTPHPGRVVQSEPPAWSRGGARGTCPPAQALVPPPSLFCDVFLRVTHPRPLWGNSWAVDHRPALVTGYSGS